MGTGWERVYFKLGKHGGLYPEDLNSTVRSRGCHPSINEECRKAVWLDLGDLRRDKVAEREVVQIRQAGKQ